jgi:hypothetical protein
LLSSLFILYQSPCFFLFLSLIHSVPLSLSLALSVSVYVFVCCSLSLSDCLSLSLWLSLSLYLSADSGPLLVLTSENPRKNLAIIRRLKGERLNPFCVHHCRNAASVSNGLHVTSALQQCIDSYSSS